MPYIALKPCEFGGEKYYVNDIIPDEFIENPKKLTDTKVIAPQKDNGNEPVENTDTFTLPLLSDDGIKSVDIPYESLSNALIIIQNNAENAVQAINECDDTDVLMVVYALDSRKSVKSAIDKRTAVLDGQGDDE